MLASEQRRGRKERMTPGQHVPLIPWATHIIQWPLQRAATRRLWANRKKNGLSSDWSLQLDFMKLELLVIAGQLNCGEYVLKSCTHRPSSQGSRECPKYLRSEVLRQARWQGLSRNKARVAEAARGIIQFESSYHLLRKVVRLTGDIMCLNWAHNDLVDIHNYTAHWKDNEIVSN